MGGQPDVPALRKRGRPTAHERRTRETEILAAARVRLTPAHAPAPARRKSKEA